MVYMVMVYMVMAYMVMAYSYGLCMQLWPMYAVMAYVATGAARHRAHQPDAQQLGESGSAVRDRAFWRTISSKYIVMAYVFMAFIVMV